MISFFRKIRHKLLAGNRVTRYLTYAIGEILLVVIGILIALQVNNWNEDRKANNSRIEYTYALLVELEKDSGQLADELEAIDRRLETVTSYFDRLSQSNSNLDTLFKIMRNEADPSFVRPSNLHTNTYLTLTSTGEIGFFDSPLGEMIQNYYQKADQTYNSAIEQTRFYQNIFSEYHFNIPKPHEYNDSPVLDQLENIMDKPKALLVFNGMLSIKRFNLRFFKDYHEEMILLNSELSKRLQESLN